MWPGASTMTQDVGVGTAGVFQSVGQDGQVVEGSVGVDGLGELLDGGGEPSRIEVDGAEEERAKNVTEDSTLVCLLIGFTLFKRCPLSLIDWLPPMPD